MKIFTDYFDLSVSKYPDKTAVCDDTHELTYSELSQLAKRIASAVIGCGRERSAVAVYMDKTPECAAAMLGTAYSGNFYVVIDSKMPLERIRLIFDVVKPFAVITEPSLAGKLPETGFSGTVFTMDDISAVKPDDAAIAAVRSRMTSSDPMYCLFTSGSTGVPKGTIVSPGNVISYTEWFIQTFDIDSNTVFGSQTPFYFSMSVTDLFSTLRTGAQLAIIPKKFFAFPIKLVQYMNEKKVNTIYWVPSALCIAANMDLFKYAKPEHLSQILFAGEVMPTKQLNYWIKYFPDCRFANLFGPTETTDICTYYVVNRSFGDGQPLPIGTACDNCRISVIGEDGRECEPGQEGELYVGGPFVASGYYDNPEKTAEAFVQDPLSTAYPEIVYRTGDIVKYNELGELIYCGRKDFQIKHMGYRIELGEIENAACAEEGVLSCACIYNGETDRIILIYEGKTDEDTLFAGLKARVPEYMLPAKLVKLSTMPHNSNGKIDRAMLKNNYKDQ